MPLILRLFKGGSRFPLADMGMNCEECTRRQFLRRSATVTGTTVLGSLWLEACSNPTAPPDTGGGGRRKGVTITLDTSLSRYSALGKVGGTLALDGGDLPGLPSDGLLIVRESVTVVRAFSRSCTHRGCTVNPFSGGVANCDCHGSQFDTQGKVKQGPATSSLFEYDASIADGIITITV